MFTVSHLLIIVISNSWSSHYSHLMILKLSDTTFWCGSLRIIQFYAAICARKSMWLDQFPRERESYPCVHLCMSFASSDCQSIKMVSVDLFITSLSSWSCHIHSQTRSSNSKSMHFLVYRENRGGNNKNSRLCSLTISSNNYFHVSSCNWWSNKDDFLLSSFSRLGLEESKEE